MIQVSAETDTDPKYAWITIDGEPYRKMAAILFKKPPFLGKFPSQEEWEMIFNQWENKTIKSFVISKLSRRRYFVNELKRLLKPHGFDEQRLSAVIQECQNLGYLDDKDGVESMVRRAIRLSKGPLWIMQQLYAKGVRLESVERYYPKEKREEVIQKFMGKKPKDRQKMIGALVRRGFSLQEVLENIKSL